MREPTATVATVAACAALLSALIAQATEAADARSSRDADAALMVRVDALEARAAVDEAVVGAVARQRGTFAPQLDLAMRRTQWLHDVLLATCSPDGYGRRVTLPDPPPGWASISPPDKTGPWALP